MAGVIDNPVGSRVNARKLTQDLRCPNLLLCISVSAGGNVDDQRKYALLFAATILAARKLHELGDKPCPSREYAISDAITKAEAILERIENRMKQPGG